MRESSPLPVADRRSYNSRIYCTLIRSWPSKSTLWVRSWDSSSWILLLSVLILISNSWVLALTLTLVTGCDLRDAISVACSVICLVKLVIILSLSSRRVAFGNSFCHLMYFSRNKWFSSWRALNALCSLIKPYSLPLISPKTKNCSSERRDLVSTVRVDRTSLIEVKSLTSSLLIEGSLSKFFFFFPN